MSKLKTLKDIDGIIKVKATGEVGPNSGQPLCDFNGSVQNTLVTREWVKRDDLRSEGIRQIKFFRKNQDTNEIMEKEFCGNCFTNETEDWVKWFFNITEEDLK